MSAASPRTDELRVADLTKRYGQGAPVIEGLSRTFAPGTATGLVGPNGSGKTTLLRLLSVVSFPTSGQVLLGGLDAHQAPHRYLRRVGIVHDDPQLPDYLNAEELLEWVLRARGSWSEAAPERISRLLDAVHLDERRANPVGTYSSGMTRKTQIAAALVAEPDVLLLDEPFRGLDTATTEAAVERLQAFKQRGGILLLSSHLRPPLEALADAYLEMHRPSSEPVDRSP